MLLGGVSIKGSYHDINQDSYKVQSLGKGFIAVLSDGLGSKKYSQIGSGAICESAAEVAMELQARLLEISPEEFMIGVHKKWIDKIKPYKVSDCNATMLIFLVYAGRALAFRLGDGFIGFWSEDDVRVLFDRKENYYANETDCLGESLGMDKIEIMDFEVSELSGGVLCSDGVGVGTMQEKELKGFTREFIEGYWDMSRDAISDDIASWLEDWPGADDKTLVYFISERKG